MGYDNWLPPVSILLLVVSCCQSAVIGVLLFKKGQASLAYINTSEVVPYNDGTSIVPTGNPVIANDVNEYRTGSIGLALHDSAHDPNELRIGSGGLVVQESAHEPPAQGDSTCVAGG